MLLILDEVALIRPACLKRFTVPIRIGTARKPAPWLAQMSAESPVAATDGDEHFTKNTRPRTQALKTCISVPARHRKVANREHSGIATLIF